MRAYCVRILLGLGLLLAIAGGPVDVALAQRPTITPTGGRARPTNTPDRTTPVRPTLTNTPDPAGRPSLTPPPPPRYSSPVPTETPTIDPSIPTPIVVPPSVLTPRPYRVPPVRPSETSIVPSATNLPPPSATPRPTLQPASGGGQVFNPQPEQPVEEQPATPTETPTPTEIPPPTPTYAPRRFDCEPWSLTFPAGVIADDVVSACEDYSPDVAQALPEDFKLLGQTVTDITLRDEQGREIPILDQPFTLCYSYSGNDVLGASNDPKNILLYTAPFSGTWSSVTAVQPVGKRVCGKVDHLTLFAPVTTIVPTPWWKIILPYVLGFLLILLIIFLIWAIRAYLRKRHADRLRELLDAIHSANESPPPPMTEVARRLRYTPEYLYEMVPDLSHAISERFLVYQRSTRGLTRDFPLEVKEVTYALHARGVYPGCDQITERIGKPWYILDPEAVVTWRAALKHLGWEKSK